METLKDDDNVKKYTLSFVTFVLYHAFKLLVNAKQFHMITLFFLVPFSQYGTVTVRASHCQGQQGLLW